MSGLRRKDAEADADEAARLAGDELAKVEVDCTELAAVEVTGADVEGTTDDWYADEANELAVVDGDSRVGACELAAADLSSAFG